MGKGRLFRFFVSTACLIVCVLLFPCPVRAEEGTAKDVTRSCRFQKNGNDTAALYAHDQKPNTVCPLEKKDVLTVQPRARNEIMGTLYFCMNRQKATLTLRQYDRDGTPLTTLQPTTDVYRLTVLLDEGCAKVEIEGEAGICELRVFGPGTVSESLPEPLPSVERTDFLIVTTHPDDEWIFLGAIYPIYGGERGYTGTFAYVTKPNIGRVHEAINSVWTAGMQTLPYFLGFPDVDRSAPQSKKDTFKAEDVTLALVRLYRKTKPLVVVSQDAVHGEYGHWQHIVTAQAALDAATLAQDETVDPESAEEYGVWTVKKVYLHLAEQNPIELDVMSPLSAYGGETALQVAKRAFREHKSQQKYVFRPSVGNDSQGDIRFFGLVYTTVGADTENDMFEHIEHNELAEVILNATPTPEPTPEPTAESTPTPTPTPEPTPKPTEKPTPTRSPEPSPEPAPTPEQRNGVRVDRIVGAALLLGAATVFALIFRKKNKKQ